MRLLLIDRRVRIEKLSGLNGLCFLGLVSKQMQISVS